MNHALHLTLLGAAAGAAGTTARNALTYLDMAARGRPAFGVGTAVATDDAMVGTSGPMTLLGGTDPRTWPATSWVVDLLPHLAYGAVTAAVPERLDPR